MNALCVEMISLNTKTEGCGLTVSAEKEFAACGGRHWKMCGCKPVAPGQGLHKYKRGDLSSKDQSHETRLNRET